MFQASTSLVAAAMRSRMTGCPGIQAPRVTSGGLRLLKDYMRFSANGL